MDFSTILSGLSNHQTLILQAPPGAGKSTILPLHILEAEWLKGQKILMLEPRRLAAKAVATRLAQQIGQKAGERVGYRIRFEAQISKATQLEVVTEGLLTRRLQTDAELEGVGLVIFDEFHERSLQADLALALCREVQQVLRPDLKILVMSATLDGDRLAHLLSAPIITLEGRQYPIDVRYLSHTTDTPLPPRMAAAIGRALAAHPTGDLLCFLPGRGEIERCKTILQEANIEAQIETLYGDMPFADQQRALRPGAQRKVVLSSAIAETSLTIEGVTVVIDGGKSRVPRFDGRSGLTRLETLPVSKASAHQRAGRAGRLQPGTCYRLWTEPEHHRLPEHHNPEILEADLAPLLLELCQWGTAKPEELTWLDAPPPGNLAQARELLRQLKALDVNNRITQMGRQMLGLGTHPRLAHMLIKAKEAELAWPACQLAALLEEKDPMNQNLSADINLRLEAMNRSNGSGQWARVWQAAESYYHRLSFSPTSNIQHPVSIYQIGYLLAQAYPDRIALAQSKGSLRYRMANGRAAELADHDPLAGTPWLVVATLGGMAGNTQKIALASPADVKDFEGDFTQQPVLEWDNRAGQLISRTEWRLGALIAKTTPLPKPDPELATLALLEAVKKEGFSLLTIDDDTRQWMARVECLRQWRPDEGWPEMTESALIDRAEEWLGPYLTNVTKRAHFEALSVRQMLEASLPYALSTQLNKLVPTHIVVPTGSHIRIQYADDGAPPVLAVRLQEMFGLADTPTVNEGRQKVMLHLLSPGYKPIQVTQDLRSFWNNTYAEVRKEIRGRYPKHSWPDDPWTAEAVRGIKRKTS